MAQLIVMPEQPARGQSFKPKPGILDVLGMTKDEFDQTVFGAYLHHKKTDCRASIHTLPVILRGRRYLLEEVADIQTWGESEADRAARERADQAIRNEQQKS